jgi:hypothetical protein
MVYWIDIVVGPARHTSENSLPSPTGSSVLFVAQSAVASHSTVVRKSATYRKQASTGRSTSITSSKEIIVVTVIESMSLRLCRRLSSSARVNLTI